MIGKTVRIALLLGFSCALSEPAQSQAIHTVALTEQHAPGTTGDVRFYGFGPPMLNADGQVVFTASLRGDGISYSGRIYQNSGIWIGDRGSPSLVARAGDQAPGLPTGTLYKSPIRLALVKLASYNPAIGTPVFRRPGGPTRSRAVLVSSSRRIGLGNAERVTRGRV